MGTTRTQFALTRLVIPAREIHVPLAQQSVDDLERLCKAANPLIEAIAERLVLWVMPPRPQAKDQPPPLIWSTVSAVLASRAGLR